MNLSFKKNVGTRQQIFLFLLDLERLLFLKDGAYFCCCAYVFAHLEILGFQWVTPTNTGIFLRVLKQCGESRTQQVLLVHKKKIGSVHVFSDIIKVRFDKKKNDIHCFVF